LPLQPSGGLLSDSIAINQGDPANNLFLLTEVAPDISLLLQRVAEFSFVGLYPETCSWHGYLVPASVYLVSTELLKDSHALFGVAPRSKSCRGVSRLMDNALSIAADYIAWDLDLHANLNRGSARERLAAILSISPKALVKRRLAALK